MFEKRKLRKHSDSMLGYVYETDKQEKFSSIDDDFQYTTTKFNVLKYYIIIFNPRKGKLDLIKLKKEYYKADPSVPNEIDSFEVIDMAYYMKQYQTEQNLEKAIEMQNAKENKKILSFVPKKYLIEKSLRV